MTRTIFVGAKGGVGCSTAAAAFAVLAAQRRPVALRATTLTGTLDLLAILGQPRPADLAGPWTVTARPGLDLLHGCDPTHRNRTDVVVDVGTDWPWLECHSDPADEVVAVLRGPDYLGLHRLIHATFRPTRVLVVVEKDRTVTVDDVADCLGLRPGQVLSVDASADVARAVDAGLLAGRAPRALARRLVGLVPDPEVVP